MIIYKTTNLINGKIYVGKDEKNNPNYFGSGKILKRAIKKYGIDNFKKETIETGINREDLNEKEKKWIKSLNSIKNGYNILEGGTGGGMTVIPVYQYNKNGSFIKKWKSATDAGKELKIERSGIRKSCKNKLLSCGGFIWSDRYYKNGVKSYENNKIKTFLQYNKNGTFIKEWESFSDIKKIFSIKDFHSIDKKNRTMKGFIWLRKKGKIEMEIDIPKREYNKKIKTLNNE
jgi:hypothetical protein